MVNTQVYVHKSAIFDAVHYWELAPRQVHHLIHNVMITCVHRSCDVDIALHTKNVVSFIVVLLEFVFQLIGHPSLLR